MVKVSVDVHHTYKYPMEFVASIHLTKYPNNREPNVVGITEVEKYYDVQNKVRYWRRIAHCRNIIPARFCQWDFLKIPSIELEEECWMHSQPRKFVLSSRSLTWTNYATIWEKSTFRPCPDNPKWTLFEQHGEIDAHNVGPFAHILALFAKRFLTRGANKAIEIMEEMMVEKYPRITDKSAFDSTYSSASAS